jgi:hypothetical protein
MNIIQLMAISSSLQSSEPPVPSGQTSHIWGSLNMFLACKVQLGPWPALDSNGSPEITKFGPDGTLSIFLKVQS